MEDIKIYSQQNEDSCCQKYINLKSAVNLCVFLASAYNIVFVPLSFGYRIRYHGVYMAFEVLTIFLYFVDICMRWSRLSHLSMLREIPDTRLSSEDRKMKNDPEALEKGLWIEKIEIGCSVVACLPILSILSFIDVYDPWLLVCMLGSLRLTKILPVLKFFDRLKERNLNLWRIIEVLTWYYLICHYVTCLLLANAAYTDDARETWLRRIPVPQDEGIREKASVWEDMTPMSIYIHGFYFVVNTISHVAIGDITSVTTNERMFNAFVILCGTFIYSFLFGNVTAIVSSLAPNQHMAFYRKYNLVMSKIKNGKTPQKTLLDVNLYFDYQWSLYKGLNVDEMMAHMPEVIKSDILLSRYQDTVETSLLFRESTGQIDVAMAGSIFKKMKISVYSA